MFKLSELLSRKGITLRAKERAGAADIRTVAAALEQFKQDKGYTRAGGSLEELAHKIGVKTETVSQCCIQTYGVPFRQWRTSLRIQEAKRLLVGQPEAAIPEISRAVGISDRRNFARQFKAITGMSPARFREVFSAGGTEGPDPAQAEAGQARGAQNSNVR